MGGSGARFADTNSLGLALRNTPRVVPVLVLGVALALGMGLDHLDGTRRRVAGAVVLVIVGVAISPVLHHGFLSSDFDRPEHIRGTGWTSPPIWTPRHPAAGSSRSPGSTSRPTTGETPSNPSFPGSCTDRPSPGRSSRPAERARSNLLGALDRQFQQSTFDPATLAPIARLFGASDVVVRGDLDSARFGLPDAADLVRRLAADPPPDFEVTGTYGKTGDGAPILLRLSLASTILDCGRTRNAVLLAGDGVGIVEAAAAGLIDGRTTHPRVDRGRGRRPWTTPSPEVHR